MHDELRAIPLLSVFNLLGVRKDWKTRKGGSEHFGKCPFHEAKRNTTSFSFDESGKFHCFSCGAKGKGAIDAVMQLRKVAFQQSVALLQDFVASPAFLEAAKKPEIKQVQELPTENQPFKGTYEKFAVESSWLKDRGFTPETLKRFEVFEYQNEKRRSPYHGSVMLKIRRYSDGECVGYLVRNTGAITPEKPKYVFPRGFHKGLELFGSWQIKNEASRPLRVVYLVESPFSVLRFHQLGFPAVSPFGWSVSDEQVNILCHLTRGVIYLPDRNKEHEGSSVAEKMTRSLWVRYPGLPPGVDDPEQLTAEQIRALT
jgi:DNA primase